MKMSSVPPSLDRIAHERRLFAIVSIALLAVVALGAILLFSGSPSKLREFEKLDARQLEQERKQELGEFQQALATTQAFVLQQVNPVGIKRVNWQTPRHEGHNGYYSIEGTVDFTYEDGETYSVLYQVTAVKKNGGWQVSKRQFKRVSTS